ncbi:LAQU0S12e02278g1_1 [Lachancea quebecensis]|uniref:LAQU0S12e02278g1_1 n=1 Tax=Lachancea quebecensis TaxID=1654605 RepID=A0A0P1KUV0_9SACH|nr:LAQU0S12e02278g1_1 [Lachancea quebecensis]
MVSVASLQPDWCISIDYSKENVAELLTELSAKGLHALTRPGHTNGITYVFVKNGDNKVPLIASRFAFVKNIAYMPDQSARSERQSLAQKLIKGTLILSDDDLKSLVSVTGSPAVGVYFSFAKFYTRWLMGLALVGAAFRLFSGKTAWEFNLSYAILVVLWAIGFVVTWNNRAEPEYAASLQYSASEAESKKSSRTVFIKKMCFIPVALQFAACLVCFQFICFLLEIFITQIYQGPLAGILALLPTVLISAYIPVLSAVYDKVLDKLVSWESSDDPVKSKLQKKFVITFLTSYVPLFITLFVYLPMGHHVNAQLASIARFCSHYNIPVLTSGFKINTTRYQKQFFYFVVTNQVIALFLENALPMILEKALPKIKGYEKSDSPIKQAEVKVRKEYSEDLEIWKQACSSNMNIWGTFDVNGAFNKLIVQFGYVAMFSSIWPLAALCCVAFNIIGMKLDIWRCLGKCSIKSVPTLASKASRQNPSSNNSMEVFWDRILIVVLWFSTLVTPALVAMYRKPSGESLASVIEKSDAWHLRSIVQTDWKTVIVFAVVFEHLAVVCYTVMGKLIGDTETKKVNDYVPAEKLEEPPHVDLEKVVEETTDFMQEPERVQTQSSTVASKALNATKHSEKGNSKEICTSSDNSGFPLVSKEQARPMQPRNTQAAQPSTEGASRNDVVSKQEKGPNSSAQDVTSLSPVAGATVPETIPTSKNYHLRYDQKGNFLNTESRAKGASSSIEGQSLSDKVAEDTSRSDVSDTANVPVTQTTSSTANTAAATQFVPSQVADTSKRHVASIINGGGQHEAQEQQATPNSGHQATKIPEHTAEKPAERNSDEQSENSSSTGSNKASHVSGTPQKSEKSSRKKIKGVLSPLGKLKKKFP